MEADDKDMTGEWYKDVVGEGEEERGRIGLDGTRDEKLHSDGMTLDLSQQFNPPPPIVPSRKRPRTFSKPLTRPYDDSTHLLF